LTCASRFRVTAIIGASAGREHHQFRDRYAAPIRDSFEGRIKAAKPAVLGGLKPSAWTPSRRAEKSLDVMLGNVSKGRHIGVDHY
jgi:hypothetical protein